MTSLNLASNNLCGTTQYGEGTYDASGNSPLTHLPCSHTNIPHVPNLGVIALANAIPDMGAMTSLNLASNGLGVKEAKIIAAVLPKCT
jgi:hypothetical protein